MSTVISSFLLVPALALLIPVAVFLVEIVAAVMLTPPPEPLLQPTHSHRRVAVLVPAHNEGTGLIPTLTDIKAQMNESDRLVVVADNCTDKTAEIAAATGAEVIVRNDPARRGKAYALAWGLRHLGIDPPDTVIIIDADCRLADAAIDRLAAASETAHRPIQALYLMTAPVESPINYKIAQFAWRVKNWLRPLGLKTLGLPCQLMGTGMAFPWGVISSAELASESIVEDLKLGLDLALAGTPPVFCPFLGVTSNFPPSFGSAQSQRARWEQGHLATILTMAPRLFVSAIVRADFALLALALDLAVPPLTLLGMLAAGMAMVAGLAAVFTHDSAVLLVSAANLIGLIGGVILSWLKCGRDILPPSAILLIPAYVIKKIPIYRQFFSRKSESKWIKTDRSNF